MEEKTKGDDEMYVWISCFFFIITTTTAVLHENEPGFPN